MSTELDRLESMLPGITEELEEIERRKTALVLMGTRSSREYWVWNEVRRTYTGPHSREALRKVLERDCPTAVLGPKLERKSSCLYNSAGGYRDPADVFMHCGQTIDRLDLVGGRTTADFDFSTRTLTAGIARFRDDIGPQYSEQVETWFHHLAGDQIEPFLDWMATFRQITDPTSAVYLQGVASAGKEMLALGIARLFDSRKYLRYESLTGDFNDGLLQTGLVYADEKMPDQGMRRGAPSAVFRTLTGSDQHEVNGKGKDKITVTICPRVLITANGERALNLIAEHLEENAVEAIGKRILHLHPEDDLQGAREFLRSLGGRSATKRWVAGDGIAAHILWLEQTRQVQVGSRFLVEGNVDRARRLIVGHDMDRVLEALLCYLQDYDRDKARATDGPGGLALIQPTRRPGIVPVDGDLFVRSSDLVEIWRDLLPDDRYARPSKSETGRMLSSSGKRHQVVREGERMVGYLVAGDLLVQKAKALDMGSEEHLRRVLSGQPAPRTDAPKGARSVLDLLG